MRNHVHFKFDGTFVWQYVLLIGEVWELVWSEGKALCRQQGEWSLVEGKTLHHRREERHLERRRLEQVSRKVR